MANTSITFHHIPLNNEPPVRLEVIDNPEKPIQDDIIKIDGKVVKKADKGGVIAALQEKVGDLNNLALAARLWSDLPEKTTALEDFKLTKDRTPASTAPSFIALKNTPFAQIATLFKNDPSKVKDALLAMDYQLTREVLNTADFHYLKDCEAQGGETCQEFTAAVTGIEFQIARLQLAGDPDSIIDRLPYGPDGIQMIDDKMQALKDKLAEGVTPETQLEYENKIKPAIKKMHIQEFESLKAYYLQEMRLVDTMDDWTDDEKVDKRIYLQGILDAIQSRLGELNSSLLTNSFIG